MIGRKAPAFALKDQHGKLVRSTDFAGRILVVYFYPKDFTPGCTLEARDFRKQWSAIKKAGAAVVGVSRDTVERHKQFAAKYGLPFQLLADGDGAVCRAYKVWGKKSMYGRIFMGVIRSTFVIDRKGVVRHAIRKVKVTGHAAEIARAVGAL
jgi:peroxiredoxin Q/BCP